MDVKAPDGTERRHATSTLSKEARFFVRQTTPRIITPLLVAALAWRVVVAAWTWTDAILVAAMVAAQPFVEWVIHVFILHWKPKRLFGRTFDPLIARKHREHHGAPQVTEWIFVPLPVLAKAMPLTALLILIALPYPLSVTAMTTGLAILLTYEWTHYLIHSRYRPRSRLYRYIWRAHRLHHFKNENYWFGVTNPLGDHVLGTFPAKSDVDTSPTCKNLAGETA